MSNYEIGLTIIVIALSVLGVCNRIIIARMVDMIDLLLESHDKIAELVDKTLEDCKAAKEAAVSMHNADRKVLDVLKAVLDDMKKMHYGNG